jgi:NAD(P)H-dependent FMN reductase
MVCGSLRASSSNAAVLEALALVLGEGHELTRYAGLADLPAFNPDLDIEPPHPAVRVLRDQIAAADALIVSCPEYAHGVPGALKNALDWLVSGVEIYGKPVVLLNPSPRSLFAHAQLAETLRTMGAALPDSACVTLPIAGRGLDAAGVAADPRLSALLRGAVDALLSDLSSR